MKCEVSGFHSDASEFSDLLKYCTMSLGEGA